MNKYLLIGIVVLLSVLGWLSCRNKVLKEEVNRQSGNVSALMGEVKRYKVNDSLNAVSVSALRLNVAELKEYREADAKLIKELKLRPKDVEYITKAKTVTRDSLIYKVDTVGCFHYRDRWLTVDACIRDSSMFIESRDSIAQVIHVDYKHRFLWWRWGVKSIRQEIVNFNPRSTVEYSEVIKVEK